MLVLRTFLVALALMATAPAQEARSLVVYPFTSQETLLGTAVADRLATALTTALTTAPSPAQEGRLEVIRPELTPLLVPLLATGEGFVSPLAFLDTPFEAASAAGAQLLRGAFGADAAVSGEVFVRDSRLELLLFVATAEGTRRYHFQAPPAAPGTLAAGAARVIREALDLPPAPGAAGTDFDLSLDLSTAYGDYVRALVLIGAGFAGDATEALEQALEAPEAEPDWQTLLDEIRTVQEGGEAPESYLGAALALSLGDVSEARAEEAFARLAESSGLPVPSLWVALLRRSQGDSEGADAAFEAAAGYPFGAAARALHLADQEPERAQEALAGLGETPMAATLAASLAAGVLGDLDLEARLTERLGRQAPTLLYAFERRSFIAFDQDDALAAARALVVATRLAPQSDLYWTNLGWAYYLLGFLERSEEASLRAISLDDSQVIAWYNLGLVETVTGRLAEAMSSYDAALLRDQGVNAESIEDLEAALLLYPDEPGVHFALASLYAADGRRQEAVRQFGRYLERGDDPTFLAQAGSRIEVLSAPAPAIALGEGSLSLRPGGAAETVFRQGDRLFAGLELTTDGFELPGDLNVGLRLVDAAGSVLAESTARRDVPRGAVALRLDDLGLDLPDELAEGAYTLEVTVTASEAREARHTIPFTVQGAASLARQLQSRGVSLRALETGAPLLSAQAATQEEQDDADAQLLAALQAELSQTADVAEEILPEVGQGRFAGLSGGALFRESSEADLRDFLSFVIAEEGFSESALTFVDAYAQWALEGAPTP